MKSNFESLLKKKAISTVESFKDFKASRVKVLSNSPEYPNSITLSYDIYCADVDGYIFNNCVTNEQYALTACDVSTALNNMIKENKCWKPRSHNEEDLLRLTFDKLIDYKF